jgi:hypothetical protein
MVAYLIGNSFCAVLLNIIAQLVAARIGLAQLDGSEWQLALGLLSWMDAMAARGNPHWACSAEWTRMARVAARSGLASLDGPGADRSKSTSCGPQQWRVYPDREHG